MVQQIVSGMSSRDCSYSHDLDANACTGSQMILGERLLKDLRKWLTPPDPSTNHTIACDAQHERTAAWVFNEDVFKEWESSGSLLWIHGKGMTLYAGSRVHMSLTTPGFVAGSGKSILWFGISLSLVYRSLLPRPALQSSSISSPSVVLGQLQSRISILILGMSIRSIGVTSFLHCFYNFLFGQSLVSTYSPTSIQPITMERNSPVIVIW